MRNRIVASVIGLFLLVAAGLKLYGLNVAPYAQAGALTDPALQFAAAEWEIVLGLWLMSRFSPLGAWLAALLTFLGFAMVSFYLGVIGQSSCGCFGSLEASPWHAFAVDATALLLLAIGPPDFRGLSHQPGGHWQEAALREFGVAIAALAICTGGVGLASVASGSPGAVLAHFRGERVSVRPSIVDMGSGQGGEVLEKVVEIVNHTGEPVTILGGTSDCSCVVTADLPVTIAPGEAHKVLVRVRLSGSPGYFHRKAWFWTDRDGVATVQFGLGGRVKPRQSEVASVAGK